jgi:hypothetical protein
MMLGHLFSFFIRKRKPPPPSARLRQLRRGRATIGRLALRGIGGDVLRFSEALAFCLVSY